MSEPSYPKQITSVFAMLSLVQFYMDINVKGREGFPKKQNFLLFKNMIFW